MALKTKITKAEFEALDDAQKFFYKAEGDSYKLDIDDAEIAAEMRRGKEREQQRATDAEERARKAEERLAAIEGDDARKRGDIESIERSWADKLKVAETKAEKTVSALKTQLEKIMVHDAVMQIARDIFTKPDRDYRLISDRVYIDYDGETPIVRIRDKDGKASALTLQELRQETLDNGDYADILIGSKATGSGGAGGNQGGGAAKQPSEYTESERAELYRTNPEKFRQLFPQTV